MVEWPLYNWKYLRKKYLRSVVLRPHLHISGYPCKRILLKTFTQTITRKCRKRISVCGYFVNGYLSGYSINAYINRFDRFRVNKFTCKHIQKYMFIKVYLDRGIRVNGA